MVTNWNKTKVIEISEESQPAVEQSITNGTEIIIIKSQDTRTILETQRFKYSKILPNGTVVPLDVGTSSLDLIDQYINYCKLRASENAAFTTPTIPNIIIQNSTNPNIKSPQIHFNTNAQTQTNFTHDISTSTNNKLINQIKTRNCNRFSTDVQTQTKCTRDISTSTSDQANGEDSNTNCSDNELLRKKKKICLTSSSTHLGKGPNESNT